MCWFDDATWISWWPSVARTCDVLLLTVPDDMLENVVTQLAASGETPGPDLDSATAR